MNNPKKFEPNVDELDKVATNPEGSDWEKSSEPKIKLTFPDVPAEQLSQIAKDIAANLIYTDRHLNEKSIIGSVFMPLLFGALNDVSKEDKERIGMIYEYYDQSLPRSINGQPIFMSCRFLNKNDTEVVWEKVQKIQKAIEGI